MKKENIEDIYKLSAMQHGMLFHSLYESDSDLYFRQLSCTLGGELNFEAFERAWREVVQRHPILRTSFHWEKLAQPIQVVHRQAVLPLEQHDWRGVPAEERRRRLEDFLRADAEKKFDLSQAPLMRLALIRLTEDESHFVLSNHHLLLDGWSRFLLLKEVLACYHSYSRGQTPQLAPARPYRDYIAWLKGQDLGRAEAFWRQLLKGFTRPTPFAVDRDSGGHGGASQARDEQRLTLCAETTAALQSFAARHQLTLNTLLQGAWALLLSRYSGEQDIVFGSVVSGRPPSLAGVEAIVGVFINTLPVRVRVPAEAELLSWLKSLQMQQAEMREYEYSPLVQVQAWAEVARGLPLFESILVVDNYPVDASLQQGGGLTVSDMRGVEQNNYPVAVAAIPGIELLLRMPFDRSRFEPATIARMLRHLQTLLEGMIADPAQRLADVPLLSEAERRQLRDVSSDDRVVAEGAPLRCAHESFEAQAEQTPEAFAVSLGAERLTYGELNHRSNQLARHLRKLGVVPETLVGVCLERSTDWLVALLGVLKAGGVYLPLDPGYPEERLDFMLQDAAPGVILTSQEIVPQLPFAAALSEVVCMDSDWGEIAQEEGGNVPGVATGDALAYVIYTSGSTGTPKGVCVSHAALGRHCAAAQQHFAVEARDRVLQFASFNFDVSIEQIFSALTRGAEMVLRGEEIWGAPEFFEKIGAESLTVVNPPTAYWNRLAQEAAAAGQTFPADHLRLMIAGGDVMLPEVVRRWQQSPYGSARLLNAYGPTEATITSLIFEIPPSAAGEPALKRVPIGRPLLGRTVFVLDAQGGIAPVGVAGELHIGGGLLARGYLKRPELTAEKFIPDPFGTEPGARLYRTGDLARYLPDGSLEFLGRADQQVKIRGYRIELGEVEAALSQHPFVREAVAHVWESEPGEKQLVAYVVTGGEVGRDELRTFLAARLPEYFIPSAFVTLDELPLTPNGKVNRQALPAPQVSGGGVEESGAAPATPAEELLANAWADILGVTKLSRHDNFFELGGHSLLATQVVSRVREVFGVELPLRALFDSPTVAGLAARIEGLTRGPLGLDAPPIAPASRGQESPLSFAQQRLWFMEQMEPGTATRNRPQLVRLRGRLNAEALEQSLREVIRRHEVLRTIFKEVAGDPVQVVLPDADFSLPSFDLGEQFDGEEREARALEMIAEESVRPFDLSRGPLLRALLLRLDEDDHFLLLTMHHIVTDGWSAGVFIREMATLYEAFLEGQPHGLPRLPIQYADYAHWQHGRLQGEVLESHLAYWTRQLASLPHLRLTAERQAEDGHDARGAARTIALPESVSDALKDLSRREGVTLFMTLLAAFKTLLYRYTGQEDVVVGTPIANRDRAETENLIGFFVNLLVLRTDLSGEPSFRQLLQRVREVTLNAYAHQELPFEKLVDVLQPERRAGRTPLFQVMFVLQNAPRPPLELPGLSISPVRVDKGTSHYDLNMSVTDAEGGLTLTLEFNTGAFAERTVEQMLRNFAALLEAVAASPEQQLLEITLPAAEGESEFDGGLELSENYQEEEFAFDLV